VLTPYPLSGLGEQAVIRVACGSAHFVLLLANGEVYSVGDNSHGALGAGAAIEASSKAVLVALPAAASAVAASNTSRFGLNSVRVECSLLLTHAHFLPSACVVAGVVLIWCALLCSSPLFMKCHPKGTCVRLQGDARRAVQCNAHIDADS
jgi:hypothetical protein